MKATTLTRPSRVTTKATVPVQEQEVTRLKMPGRSELAGHREVTLPACASASEPDAEEPPDELHTLAELLPQQLLGRFKDRCAAHNRSMPESLQVAVEKLMLEDREIGGTPLEKRGGLPSAGAKLFFELWWNARNLPFDKAVERLEGLGSICRGNPDLAEEHAALMLVSQGLSLMEECETLSAGRAHHFGSDDEPFIPFGPFAEVDLLGAIQTLRSARH